MRRPLDAWRSRGLSHGTSVTRPDIDSGSFTASRNSDSRVGGEAAPRPPDARRDPLKNRSAKTAHQRLRETTRRLTGRREGCNTTRKSFPAAQATNREHHKQTFL